MAYLRLSRSSPYRPTTPSLSRTNSGMYRRIVISTSCFASCWSYTYAVLLRSLSMESHVSSSVGQLECLQCGMLVIGSSERAIPSRSFYAHTRGAVIRRVVNSSFARMGDALCNVVEQVGFCGNASLTDKVLLRLNRLPQFFFAPRHSS